jgi:hypothetical protein
MCYPRLPVGYSLLTRVGIDTNKSSNLVWQDHPCPCLSVTVLCNSRWEQRNVWGGFWGVSRIFFFVFPEHGHQGSGRNVTFFFILTWWSSWNPETPLIVFHELNLNKSYLNNFMNMFWTFSNSIVHELVQIPFVQVLFKLSPEIWTCSWTVHEQFLLFIKCPKKKEGQKFEHAHEPFINTWTIDFLHLLESLLCVYCQ